jgi:hypothetical protein
MSHFWFQLKSSNLSIDSTLEPALTDALLAPLRVSGTELNQRPENCDIELTLTPQSVSLSWQKSKRERLTIDLNMPAVVANLRSFPAPKQGAFNQALGRKTRHVLDATGGWGGDALLMCQQGYQVTIQERDPLMAVVLTAAFAALKGSDWAIKNQVTTPTVLWRDSGEETTEIVSDIDCVYLDPMFPPKRKKSAAVNKQMQFLQWWVGADEDATQMTQAMIASQYPRVVVKRPTHAEPLVANPSTNFSSKLVQYDVYL